jgi:tagatose 6-phosphate kinase
VFVTVTLNPVLRVDYAAGAIAVGEMNQVQRARYRAAGRGLAVARVLHTFGHDVVAAGLAGGSAGDLIRHELSRAGVATQFTRIGAESRRVLAVADSSAGQVTGFAEASPYITTEELGRLAADYRGLLTAATAVVLCGDLPDGLPAEIYGSFASYAAEAGVPVVLNAGGTALVHGAGRRPTLVVPEPQAMRDQDASEPGPDGNATAAGATAPAGGATAAGGAIAVISGDAVRVLTDAGEWRAGLSPLGPQRPTGPGGKPGEGFRDALVAGFVPGIALGWSWPDILRHAVALAAAWSPDGKLDERTYEETLIAVTIDQLPLAHRQ